MVTQPYFKGLPYQISDNTEFQKRVSPIINSLLQGKMNVTLSVTLNPNATQTIVKDARISFYSAVIPAMATTSDAAIALAAGVYVTSLMSGSATINHASSAATDQTIIFVILG